jgi:hypothetical protein
MAVEVLDVAPGLWLWRQPHPDWEEGADWPAEVASFAVESGGVSILLDPLAPPPAAAEVWERIEASPPSVVAVLKPDHLRDVELFVRWYGARAFGPFLFCPTTSPAPTSSGCGPTTSSPAGRSLSTTAAKGWRRRSTSPSNGRWSSPTV